MTIAVYTATYGSEADPLFQPNVVSPHAEYFCFSDGWRSGPEWSVGDTPREVNPRCEARRRKVLSHQYLPAGFEATIWIDASFRLLVTPELIVEDARRTGSQVVAMRHPDRRRITDEAQSVIRCNQAPREKVEQQLAAYQNAGFDTALNPQQVLTATGIVVRFMGTRVREFEEYWWTNLELFTLRDQMSIDFCAAQCGITIGYLDGHYRRNPYAAYYAEKTWR